MANDNRDDDSEAPPTLRYLRDVRDGLTREERVVLFVLRQVERERRGRNVPTAMLYGRVVEYLDISPEEFQACLNRLIGTSWEGEQSD